MVIVSIVVPVFRAEKYIRDCIESVLHQTFKSWELILVDDCGGDNSLLIVKEYALKDERIRYLENERNVGPMAAREKGYKTSKGEYITFLDSDDVLPNYAIESLLQKAHETKADVVSGSIEYFNSDGTSKKWINNLSFGKDKVSVYKSVFKGEFTHNLCGKLFLGVLLRNYTYSHFENFTNGEDSILFYEILDNIKTAEVIPDVVYYYRHNPTSSSQSRLNKHRLENVIIANAMNYQKCIKYPELSTAAYCYFSKCLNDWYVRGYNQDGVLDALIRENKLEKLVRPIYMLRNLPLISFFKQILKRYIVR